MGVVCAYGFYEVMKGIKEQRENAREKIWARIHLTPMLQAEADRDDVRRYFASQAREKELMKDEKGWDFASVYNVDKYVHCNGEATHGNCGANQHQVHSSDLHHFSAAGGCHPREGAHQNLGG
jgi:hypothetical protein